MSSTGNITISGSGITTTTFATGGVIMGGYANPTAKLQAVGGGGGGVVAGMDIMYDMEGVRLEEGQNVVVAFGNGVTGKLRIGRISDVRRDVGEIVVTWQRGWDIPKRPSRIKVSENRILVVA